ncbi:hypothetical protein KBC75_04660 [Candidatus Shapirobacteria bacterium]|nr:hypothetical protein [Candidatus Shapirobacteria bacterium]
MISHKNKNIILFLLGLILVFLFSVSPLFNFFIKFISGFGLVSAFIAGMLFVSTFTVAGGGLILLSLAKILPPTSLIFVAGLGAVTGDWLVFTFVKSQVISEISPIYERFLEKHHLKKLLHTRYFAWTLPVIGALVIASPLPDELGISLMGLSSLSPLTFLLISLASHALGMTILVSLSLLT